MRWTVRFTIGELVGFGLIPALGGVLVHVASVNVSAIPRALMFYAVAILGGLGEGAVLASFQFPILRELFPSLDRSRWITHTGIAAASAWALGMLAPTLDDLVGLSAGLQIAISIPASVLILCSIGFVQARLLRGHIARPRRWLIANVVGWLGGLPWTFVLPMLVPDDAPMIWFAAAFAIGGVLMGATTGAITGVWLVRFRREIGDETVQSSAARDS